MLPDGATASASSIESASTTEGGLHEWGFGEDERNRELLAEAVNSVGAFIVGRRTHDDSLPWWGADGPHPPTRVFVVTHEAPDAVPEGSVYTFVTDGIENALELAKAAAREKDVAVTGAEIGRQYIEAGLSTRSPSISCPSCSGAASGCSST